MKNTCEESVFNEIFRSVSSDLYKFLYHRFGADGNPDDIVQESFLALWENCSKIIYEKAKSYVFTVAYNKTLKAFRKDKTAVKYISLQDKNQHEGSPQEVLEEKEFRSRLENAINDLPEKQRIAFMLNRTEGKKHKEIAEMLGISVKAVEKRIYKAADHLLKKMGRKI